MHKPATSTSKKATSGSRMLLGSNAGKSVALAAASLALLAAPASAHMRMLQPPPLRGVDNKFYDFSSYDYSMTSPLAADGSDFPAKKYIADVPTKSSAVATVKAGQQFTVSLAGTTLHDGGSCQFSLSYDGTSFGVIHSVIGGCPLAKSYTFPIPSDVPAGKNVFLCWSWFNKVGNREMYMNCAAVDIDSSSTATLTLPAMFEANIFGAGTCNTIEGDELVFPNPGKSIEYGGMWAGKTPKSGDDTKTTCSADQLAARSITLSANAGASPGNGNGNGDSDSSSGSGSGSPSIPPVSVSIEIPVSVSSSSSLAASSAVASSSSSPTLAFTRPGGSRPTASSSSSAVVAPSSSSSSESSSSSLSLSSSIPASSSSAHPLPVNTKLATTRRGSASSTGSSSTAPTSEPSSGSDSGSASGGACSGSALKCASDGKTFSVCAAGAWVAMGDVAPGTLCVDGSIVMAPSSPEGSSSGSSNATTNTNDLLVRCTPASIRCATDGQSFMACNASGRGYTNMGKVSPGTKCENGKIVRAGAQESMLRMAKAKERRSPKSQQHRRHHHKSYTPM